jgi:hypothetical protein
MPGQNMKIAIFYHCLFLNGEPPKVLPAALSIIPEQMALLKTIGLLDAASDMIVGVNGSEESRVFVDSFLPAKARVVFHGLQCKNECRTLLELEKWLTGHEDWYVLYFHAKGSTHPLGDSFSATWRNCMTRHVIQNWKQCVADLDAGFEAVGCHWMVPPATPIGQHIFAGTFWFAKSSYLLTLPSIMLRDRIKVSGIDSAESRYEAEVWIGNGPRLPKVRDYHGPNWDPSKIGSCA